MQLNISHEIKIEWEQKKRKSIWFDSVARYFHRLNALALSLHVHPSHGLHSVAESVGGGLLHIVVVAIVIVLRTVTLHHHRPYVKIRKRNGFGGALSSPSFAIPHIHKQILPVCPPDHPPARPPARSILTHSSQFCTIRTWGSQSQRRTMNDTVIG